MSSLAKWRKSPLGRSRLGGLKYLFFFFFISWKNPTAAIFFHEVICPSFFSCAGHSREILESAGRGWGVVFPACVTDFHACQAVSSSPGWRRAERLCKSTRSRRPRSQRALAARRRTWSAGCSHQSPPCARVPGRPAARHCPSAAATRLRTNCY